MPAFSKAPPRRLTSPSEWRQRLATFHEIGGGALTFDLTAGRVSGWAEPFWTRDRYELVQTSFATGATTFAATFGAGGILEGRFFGPRAVNVAVRAKGGGPGMSAVRGIMTGSCQR
jgi:hypothetical protein